MNNARLGDVRFTTARCRLRIGMPAMTFGVVLASALALPVLITPRASATTELMRAGQQDSDNAAAIRLYNSGNGLLNRGLHDLAAREYRSFLQQYGDHEHAPTARYGLGVCLYRLEQFAQARDALRPLSGADSNFAFAAEAKLLLGRSHLALSENDEAAAVLATLVRDHRSHDLADDAAALQCEALFNAGQFDQVATPAGMFAARWEDSPWRDRAELFWGLSEFSRGQWRSAADRFAGLLERDDDGRYAGQATLMLAKSHHRLQELDEAADAYRKSVRRGEESTRNEARYGLAVIEHGQGRLNEAGSLLDDLLRDRAGMEWYEPATLLRGRVWFDQERYDRAAPLFEQLQRTAGDLQDDGAYWRAKCSLRDRNPADAERRLAQAQQQFPTSALLPQMRFDRAVALVRLDRDRDAEAALGEFLSNHPAHALAPDALHMQASAAHRQSAFARSRTLCQQFAARYEDHALRPAIDFLAAENLFLEGAFDDAVDAYRGFLTNHADAPQRDNASYRLGMSLYRLDQFDAARPLLEAHAKAHQGKPSAIASQLALGDGFFQRSNWDKAQEHLEQYVVLAEDQHDARADALLKLGLARHRQDDHEGALRAFDTLLRAIDENDALFAQAAFERGQTLVSLDRADDARQMFDSVLTVDGQGPLAIHALNHLSVIAMQKQDYDEVDRLAGLMAAHPGAGDDASGSSNLAADAINRRGRAAMAAGRYADAAGFFKELLDNHSDSQHVPSAAAQRAVALARSAKPEVALAALEQVDRVYRDRVDAPLLASVMYEKAWCHRSLDQLEDAAEDYQRVITINAGGDLPLHARVELAQLHMDQEDYHLARPLLATVRTTLGERKTPPPAELDEQSLYGLGICAYRMDDHRQAATLMEQFVNTFAASERASVARLLCAESHYHNGSQQQAITHLKAITKAGESDVLETGLLRLGEYLTAMQYWAQAAEAFEQHQAKFADSELWFQSRFGIGWAAENQNEHDRAIESYRKVVDRHDGPTAARAQFQIGECFFAMERHADAASELLKVDILYAYPQWSAAALYEAGRCFEAMGNQAEARKQYQTVRETYGSTEWARLAGQRLDALGIDTNATTNGDGRGQPG